MLTLNLKNVFAARGIKTPLKFLISAGFSRSAATILIYNNVRSLRFDHLEKLCEVLNCEPYDIIEFTPTTSNKNQPTHPLIKLKKEKQSFVNITNELASLSFQELTKLTNSIIEQRNSIGK